MSKQMSKFEALVQQASGEEMPRVDVRSRVLASITEASTHLPTDQIAFSFLLASMSIALLAVLVTHFHSSNEPPLEMITPFIQSQL